MWLCFASYTMHAVVQSVVRAWFQRLGAQVYVIVCPIICFKGIALL